MEKNLGNRKCALECTRTNSPKVLPLTWTVNFTNKAKLTISHKLFSYALSRHLGQQERDAKSAFSTFKILQGCESGREKEQGISECTVAASGAQSIAHLLVVITKGNAHVGPIFWVGSSEQSMEKFVRKRDHGNTSIIVSDAKLACLFIRVSINLAYSPSGLHQQPDAVTINPQFENGSKRMR